MKRLFSVGVAALATVTMISAANAADIARRQEMPAKAPAYVAPFYNWTGFYIGINGGGGFGRSEWNSAIGSTGSFDVTGGLVGGTIGYNWQVNNQWVFGLEGDIDWSNIKGSTSAGACGLIPTSCETKNDWLGTARGRIGYAFDRFLPYITGGLAVGDVKASAAGIGSSTDTNVGWTLGAGVEFGIVGPWTAKVEYLYVDLGDTDCSAGSCLPSTKVDFKTNIVRGGINYRF